MEASTVKKKLNYDLILMNNNLQAFNSDSMEKKSVPTPSVAELTFQPVNSPLVTSRRNQPLNPPFAIDFPDVVNRMGPFKPPAILKPKIEMQTEPVAMKVTQPSLIDLSSNQAIVSNFRPCTKSWKRQTRFSSQGSSYCIDNHKKCMCGCWISGWF